MKQKHLLLVLILLTACSSHNSTPQVTGPSQSARILTAASPIVEGTNFTIQQDTIYQGDSTKRWDLITFVWHQSPTGDDWDISYSISVTQYNIRQDSLQLVMTRDSLRAAALIVKLKKAG
jgi:outer membrane biogenesis lipoprotein LolB